MKHTVTLIVLVVVSGVLARRGGSHSNSLHYAQKPSHIKPSPAKVLTKTLLDNYAQIGGPLSRPVANDNETVRVDVGLSLIGIDKLVMREYGVDVSFFWYSQMMWKDAYLQWTPEEHGGVTSIRAPAKNLWLPDLVIFNLGPKDRVQDENVLTVVESDGSINYIPRASSKHKCAYSSHADMHMGRMGMEHNVTCTIKIGSWTYHKADIDPGFVYGRKSVDFDSYKNTVPHPAVHKLYSSAEKEDKIYDCCVETYSTLIYNVTMTISHHHHGSGGHGSFLKPGA